MISRRRDQNHRAAAKAYYKLLCALNGNRASDLQSKANVTCNVKVAISLKAARTVVHKRAACWIDRSLGGMMATVVLAREKDGMTVTYWDNQDVFVLCSA
uniref:Uncharacterized protein n=1 Tax=Hyaloperonospora arabidopsidis (strain Emoy2) TaxID=559515 RepID=M4BWS5_HYAAE